MDFPQKVLYGVFELPLLRNAQKRHKKISKIKKKKYLPTPFSGHLPDIRRFQKKIFGAPCPLDFPQKSFNRVFELPLRKRIFLGPVALYFLLRGVCAMHPAGPACAHRPPLTLTTDHSQPVWLYQLRVHPPPPPSTSCDLASLAPRTRTSTPKFCHPI
jgi:hypothetical protein